MKSTLRALLIRRLFLLCTLLLVACGGGGDSSGNKLSVHLDTNSLAWDYYSSDAPPQQVVTATLSGSYPGTVYIIVLIGTQGSVSAIDSNVPLTITPRRPGRPFGRTRDSPLATIQVKSPFNPCPDSPGNRPSAG